MKSTIKSASIVLALLISSTGIANALEYEKGNASVQAQRQAEEVNRQLDSIGFVDMNNPSQAYPSSPKPSPIRAFFMIIYSICVLPSYMTDAKCYDD